jgi:uncharacterized protein YbjT (DUF2867 family)
MRVVVIGGYGNFGARICRALAADPGTEVIAAGRNPPGAGEFPPGVTGARLDLASPDFPVALQALAPGVVVHCAGPFQGQDYRVAAAALAARAHYIDLADARRFVADFPGRFGEEARACGLLAVSGASTLPALSTAVIDSIAVRFQAVKGIWVAIAPGQRAPRGAATIAGVMSYAGRPFQWLSGGRWEMAWGWQELRRIRFAGLGTRWAAACDVPDLELLPARYPGVRTVEFHAALEPGIQHFGLWLAAALRRAGLQLPLEHWGKRLDRAASLLGVFGSDRGGMLVSVAALRADGSRALTEWHLTAEAGQGPEIPCMAASMLVRKLVTGELTTRGAFACMGLLTLAEFEREFARWRISTLLRDGPV